jgi:hypothetical protein
MLESRVRLEQTQYIQRLPFPKGMILCGMPKALLRRGTGYGASGLITWTEVGTSSLISALLYSR